MRGVRAGFQEDSVVGKGSLTDLAEELSHELPQAPLRGGITRSRGSGETARSQGTVETGQRASLYTFCPWLFDTIPGYTKPKTNKRLDNEGKEAGAQAPKGTSNW